MDRYIGVIDAVPNQKYIFLTLYSGQINEQAGCMIGGDTVTNMIKQSCLSACVDAQMREDLITKILILDPAKRPTVD